MVRMNKMILHTIISNYDIFDNGQNCIPTEFINFNGGKIEYRNYNGEKQIVRLYSSNPYNYLKKEYNPYTILN